MKGVLRVGKEDGQTNIEDLLMKVVSSKKIWDICYYMIYQRKKLIERDIS